MNRRFARLLLAVVALFVIGLICVIIFFSVKDNSLKKNIVGAWQTDDGWLFTFGENERWTISDVTEDGHTIAVDGGKYNIFTGTLTMYTEGYPIDEAFLVFDPSIDGDKMTLLMQDRGVSGNDVGMVIRYGDDELRLFVDSSYIFDKKE